MVIFYDQYGCGRSTHFPHADASFWTIARYLRQLTQLIDHLGIGHGYSILGHSWGGMLAAEHACLQPAGLRGAIQASSPASIALWQQEAMRLLTPWRRCPMTISKTSLCPPSFIKTHQNSSSLTMPDTFIPSRKKPFMFRSLMRSSPPTLRVITFYGNK
ncbi:hydrolase [Salmonella enterica subsp. diarizonae]|uniref:Hydrolase n=1 Tax=Salmonella diarizonae TaxID=59204 RepID=A0A379U111_SALDZ|nr:hydrolase [Salmonella enterica subsp. diarizonae]